MRIVSLLAAGAVCLSALPAYALGERCRVMDPTGTPLNVRTAPYGRIVDTLDNGMLVTTRDVTTDRSGRAWVYISDLDTGKPIGWVYREYIACF